MGGLFSTPKPPPPPKPVRMPTETDPSVLAAAERAKLATQQRRGRQSTIMTDSLKSQTLG
jgi:hypothetical protein